MKRILFICLLAMMGTAAEAQWGGHIIVRPGYGGYGYGRPRMRMGYRPRPQYQQRLRPQYSSFQPSVNISLGYSFPNLDKEQFASFYNLYKGAATNMTGPFTGAIDYQFSRFMSVGVLGTYGKVSMPYYAEDNNSRTPDLTGHFENWSLMLNLMTYFPTHTRAVSPYLRTAVGYQNWTQDYSDAGGNKTEGVPEPSALAYQVSLGTKLNLSPRAGLFVEAGYGKYILNGGLALKF